MDYFGAAGSLLSGIGSYFGDQAEAKGFADAARYYQKAAKYSDLETKIKDRMTRREIFKTIGGAQADVAASGLAMSGSAIDVIQDSAREGALSLSLVKLQGQINTSSYMAQAQQASASASAKKKSSIFGAIGSVISIGASLFSDDELKEDVKLQHRRQDGIGIYHFRYRGQPTLFEGVMASEIEALRPEAVKEVDGYRAVDYDMLGIKFKAVG